MQNQQWPWHNGKNQNRLMNKEEEVICFFLQLMYTDILFFRLIITSKQSSGESKNDT